MREINSFSGEYQFLSNFFIHDPIEYAGDLAKTPLIGTCVESLYQALKTTSPSKQLEISTMPPGKAKRIGKEVSLREDWMFVKVELMYELLLLKFSIPLLRDMLLATENAELIEGNYWNDTYWGVCNGVGENMLGKLLMKVRTKLQFLGVN